MINKLAGRTLKYWAATKEQPVLSTATLLPVGVGKVVKYN